MASHTLNDEEYGALVSGRRAAETRAGDLEAEVARVKLEDPANRIKPLVELVRAQLEIVRFAVANLPPETTRGWPTKALDRIADLLPALPGFVADDGDLALLLRSFARECEGIAMIRDEERKRRIAADAVKPEEAPTS